MKRFTKLFMTLALLCVAGSVSAKTEKVHADFSAAAPTGQATWDGTTKTLGWKATWDNQLKNLKLPKGDISGYKKLVVDITMKEGNQIRVLFYKNGANKTLYAKDGVNEFIIKDTLQAIAPNDFNEFILGCDEICLSGDNGKAPGSCVVNDVYLETYDDEGVKTYADFSAAAPTGQATWDGTTKTLGWKATWDNQLKNLKLPKGDISGYKKLVVDITMKEGDQIRVLFYKNGANKTLYAKDGVNVFIIKDTLEAIAPNDYNEFILGCDEICLSGDNGKAPGSCIVNEMYLETYPENESVEIPEIQYEEDPGKPEGTFVDFTEAFPTLKPTIGLGADNHPVVLGNGAVVVGQRNKDVIADLSDYSKLTMVTSPNLKLVLYMNHKVDAQQNAGDYAEGDAGKYVFLEVQAGENGLIEVDLTQYAEQDLNCICLPWDNSNKGTVWYILLTEATTVPVAIGSTGYATFSSTKAVDFTNSSIKAYTATVSGTVITFTRIYQVPANTGVLLWGAANATDNLPILASGPLSAIQDNLIATSEAMDGQALAGKYILAENDGVVGFYKAGSGASLAAGKAYLAVPTEGARIILPGNEATGINAVEAAQAEAPVYNLQGQRVEKAAKGVNIVNGKKFIVK